MNAAPCRSAAFRVVLAVASAVVLLGPTNAANLEDQQGQWTCLSPAPLAPQIQIDFEDSEYRRCDQNICSAYAMVSSDVSFHDGGAIIEIAFTTMATFRANSDGSHFSEKIVRGPTEYVIEGTCQQGLKNTATLK